MRMLWIEHLVAKKLRDKIHERTIACAKLMKSARNSMLERSCARGLGLTPHRLMIKVIRTELLS